MADGHLHSIFDVVMAIGGPAPGWIGSHPGLERDISGYLARWQCCLPLWWHSAVKTPARVNKTGLNRSRCPEVYCSPDFLPVCLNTVI